MKVSNKTLIYKRLMEPDVDVDFKNLAIKLIDPKVILTNTPRQYYCKGNTNKGFTKVNKGKGKENYYSCGVLGPAVSNSFTVQSQALFDIIQTTNN